MLESMTICIAEATPGAGNGAEGAGGMTLFVPMIAILVLFFWMTHRSQKKKEQQRKEMLDSIKVGDDVVTIGGIHGRVTKVNEESFEVRVNPEKDIKVVFSRAAVNQVLSGEKGQESDGKKSG